MEQKLDGFDIHLIMVAHKEQWCVLSIPPSKFIYNLSYPGKAVLRNCLVLPKLDKKYGFCYTEYTNAYNYNSLGQRIAKTVGDTVHEYFYEGNRLIKEVRTDENDTVHTLTFLYDASDSPIGMQYDGTAYYYKKNLQGDVIALLDANCTTVAEYVYDAWGALRTINADTLQNTLIAALNPIRYRGYYYDNETGFYFLQSRYYDPVVGRFINADETMFLGISGTVCSYNLFAYCENEPTSMIDAEGKKPTYIDNQWDSHVKDISWGLFGKTGPNGCGWISVYNVLANYSNRVTYQYVISGLVAFQGVVAFGWLGTNAISITKYLKTKFYFVHVGGPITYWWGIKAELSGAVIVLYQHKGWTSSLHYVAGIKTSGTINGLYRFYNDSYYQKKYGEKPISFWKYIDLLKENGCKPIMFWGVAMKKGGW